MASQKLRVTYTDGRIIDVLVRPKAMVEVERTYKVSLMSDADRRLEHLYYLGWAALHWSGKYGDGFEDFLNLVAEVEDITPDDEFVDPTQAAPSPDESSS